MEQSNCNDVNSLEGLIRMPDGKYLWLHTTNLYKNPIFLFLIWKVYFSIYFFVAIYIIGIVASSGGGIVRALRDMALPIFGTLCFLFFLMTFSYYLYAVISGGKYSVLFEMDQKGIRHTQLPKQFNKARKIGGLAALAGMIAGNASAAGAGLLAAGHQSMYTEFKKVRAVRINRKRHIIKLRSADLTHNQVYTAPEDFGFVSGFIKEQIGKAGARQN